MMHTNLLALCGYVLATFAISFSFGQLSGHGRVSHLRVQLVTSLVAGFILGIALFHLIPGAMDAMAGPDSAHQAALGIGLGIVAMVMLLRFFSHPDHVTCDPSGTTSGLPGVGIRRASFVSVAGGLALHATTEGLALGAAVQASQSPSGPTLLPGFGVFLAVALHKPLDAYSVLSMMRGAGYSRRTRTLFNLGFATVCPLVAIAAYVVTGLMGEMQDGSTTGYLMAFGAGVFLCIALSDLLPEIRFHSHDRVKLLVAFLIGIAVSYALFLAERWVPYRSPEGVLLG